MFARAQGTRKAIGASAIRLPRIEVEDRPNHYGHVLAVVGGPPRARLPDSVATTPRQMAATRKNAMVLSFLVVDANTGRLCVAGTPATRCRRRGCSGEGARSTREEVVGPSDPGIPSVHACGDEQLPTSTTARMPKWNNGLAIRIGLRSYS